MDSSHKITPEKVILRSNSKSRIFHTPVDVFCDTLLFLKRNEVGKSQIACRTWNKIINQYNGILPLHRIRNLTITKREGQLYVHLFSSDQDDIIFKSFAKGVLLDDLKREPFRIISLKYCIFESMKTNGVDYNSIIDVLKEFSQVSGEKLKVVVYDLDRYKSFDPLLYISYKEMLHILNYVQASTVAKRLYFVSDYDSFFLLNDIGLTTEYQLAFCLQNSWNFNENEDYQKITERLIEMLGKYENKELHRFSIEYQLSVSIEQCNRLIEIYMNAKDPSFLPVLDFAGYSDTALYLQEFVNKEKFSYTEERNYEVKEIYEIKTVEGHRLQIIFGSYPDELDLEPIRMQLIPKDDSNISFLPWDKRDFNVLSFWSRVRFLQQPHDPIRD